MDGKIKKSLNEKCQNFARFADYFVICGLDIEQGLEVDLHAESLTNLNIIPPLDRSYKSKTLANYPQNVSWNPFDSYGVCLLSLPQGLKFRTQKHDLSPRFHSFASTRDDGKRCYGFSLVFYEEIKNENISTAMQTLQSMYLTELSSSQGSLRRQENNTNRSLPRHFRINEDEKSSLSLFDIQKDTLYVSKSISLICQLPYNHIAEVFLTNLYKCLPRSPGARLSLESYVYNMLYDVKIPEYGKSIRIHLPPEQPSMMPINIILQRPKSTELPLLDYPLRLLFECLGVECVTELFTCVLLENQVLLISEDFQKLTIIAECITSLLFPFEWCHVYAPILPTALHHFLDAPCPFIMGLHSENLDENLQQRAGLCYVDIDNKKIRLPDELPIFPHKSDFISDIYEILQKFDVVDVESASQVQETSSTTSDYESILNPKSLMSNFYFSSPSNEKYGNVGYSRLSSNLSTSLSLSKSRRKKHSLHDFINDFDLSESSGSNSCLQEFSPHTPRSKTFDTRVISNELYYKDLRINAEIREMFLNRFCQIFLDYEQFVILPNQNKIEWIKNRESLHNFDKASFLSDQTTQYRSFLSQFLESQMFATLIDNKILASFDEKLAGSSKSATSSIDEQKKTDENPVSKNLLSFDHRIKILKKHFSTAEEVHIKWKNLENIPHLNSSKSSLEKRLKNFDLEVAPPVEILKKSPAYYKSFPLLEGLNLNQVTGERPNSLRRVKKKVDLDDRKLMDKRKGQKYFLREIDIDKNLSGSAESLSISSCSNVPSEKGGPKGDEFSASFVAQTNWTFVEKLLKECKTKTKRMLMEKIDTEKGGYADVEENQLITSMCDLLEKIWSHGLITPHSKSAHTKNHYHNNNQIKSPFWSHLLRYLEKIESKNGGSLMNGSGSLQKNQLLSTPALAWSIMRNRMDYLASLKIEPQDMSSSITISLSNTSSPTGSLRRQQQSRSRRSKSCEKRVLLGAEIVDLVLPKLPDTLEYDIKSILAMKELKTDIGYARAFIRLTLEKKVLSRHLKTLLNDVSILRSMYKRTAFLTYDDEKEQFLYHLLTLNAVDYFCFSQVYAMTSIPYRIVIVPMSGAGTLTRKNSFLPRLWITVFGSIGESERIQVKKIEQLIEHKNLGILRTLRIGIDGSTSTLSSSKLHLDCVWIRNEVTGHAYKFSCNRWLGKGIDDQAIERLLIGQLIRQKSDSADDPTGALSSLQDSSFSSNQSTPNTSLTESFILSSGNNEERKDPNEVQNILSDSVNKIVKWFYRHQRRVMSGVDCSNDMAALTGLLCGENGLIPCLMSAFQIGFRSQRLFGRNLFVWDFFVRCKEEFEQNLTADTIASIQDSEHRNNEIKIEIWNDYCQLVDEISKNATIGHDEKFQLFMCLCLRGHLLHRMLPALSESKTTQEMYEEKSFLRQKSLSRFLYQILQPLDAFPFNLDNSITSSLNSVS